MEMVDKIYYSLSGQLEPDAALPWVENLFASGSECEAILSEIYAARNRLQERLNAGEEDSDLECILNSFLSIQHILCREMFFYGLHF